MRRLEKAILLSVAAICVIAAVVGTLSRKTIQLDHLLSEDLPVVRTETPSQTLESFGVLSAALDAALEDYARERTSHNFTAIGRIVDALVALIDLSTFPTASQRTVGVETSLALLEINDRASMSDLDTEKIDALASEAGPVLYSVVDTPLTLEMINYGARVGEFLFSGSTARIAPRMREELRSESPDSTGRDWAHEYHQFAGPLFPTEFIGAVPPFLQTLVFGTPLWKALTATVLGMASLLMLAGIRGASAFSGLRSRFGAPAARLAYALCVLAVVASLAYMATSQINVTGSFLQITNLVLTVAWFGSLAAVFWNATVAGSDALAIRHQDHAGSIDHSLVQLLVHILALAGAVWIVAYGAQTLGFPLLSILAGLGIGGLAAALAIRPTLENLISGIVLYLDRPIRVGDFCEFGENSGTVEKIGIRSTKVRALDRTLVTIPNSQFEKMELVNWARCDLMMIEQTIGVRYETESDQLRFILAEIRRMAHMHPRIDNDTIRVRFGGYGDSSLNIELRIYAKTQEWNDFYEIREDVLFRIKTIVEGSGSSFAFPSRTLYVSKDTGLDIQKTRAANQIVENWRGDHEFPFPRFSNRSRDEFSDKLDYPPNGSPDSDEVGGESRLRDEPLASDVGKPDEQTTRERD